MSLWKKFITVPIAKNYEIVETIYTVTSEFIFILYHPDEAWPAIHAKVRYINGIDGRIVVFVAVALNENFQIAGAAHEVLEFDIISITEEILKCMYAKNATIKT